LDFATSIQPGVFAWALVAQMLLTLCRQLDCTQCTEGNFLELR